MGDSVLAGGGGGGGGSLVPLGSGGGGVSDGVSLVGGAGEPGPGSLLPGGGGGGTSLDVGPGVLGVLSSLGCGDSLVGGGGGGVLGPLELGGGGGGVSEVVDDISLAGVSDCISLGTTEPGDGPGLSGTSLDGAGVSDCEVGDGTAEGPGLVGDGDSSEPSEPTEPGEPGETLGRGGGPLADGGTVTELSVVLVPLGVSDVGLVESADGSETTEDGGTSKLDGPAVDDAGGVEPELGWPDGGDIGLLPGVDVGDALGADGAPLLGSGEGCELAVVLADSPGLPDVCEPDACETEVGDPDVGLALEGSTLVGEVDGPLLGAPDDGADWLGTLGDTGLGGIWLAESPELPDAGDVDGWLSLDGPALLDVTLAYASDAELGVGLDPADAALLSTGDDAAEALPTLSPLLLPLTGDVLSLAGLALLASLRMDEGGLAFDDSPDAFDDAGLNDDASLFTLDTWLDGIDDGSDAGEDDPPDFTLEASLGADDPLGCDDGLARLDDASEDRSQEDCEPLEALAEERDGLALDDLRSEPLETDDASLFEERLSDDGEDIGDEPLLCDFDDSEEEERADGVEIELRDFDDLLPDEPDELRPELLVELFDKLPNEPLELDRPLDDRSDEGGPLEPELRRLPLGLLCDKLSTELLSDESLDELGDDRGDSLTLENDLLDP